MIRETVIEIVAKVKRIPPETVSASATFEDLGVDSLDATEIVFGLEEVFDIDVDDQNFKTLTSIDDVANAFKTLLESHTASETSEKE